MGDIETTVNEFVLKCWGSVSGTAEFIYVSQIPQVVEKMEQKLSCKLLLTTQELRLLNEMMTDKPLLKLYKAEFKNFMMKLVGYKSWLKLLMDRVGVSQFNLSLLLDQQPQTTTATPLKPAAINSPMINTSTPIKARDYKTNIDTPEPSRGLHRWKSNLDLKDKHIDQRDQHITTITKENQELFQTTKSQVQKIKQLELRYDDLKHYVDILETKLDNNSSNKGNARSDRIIVKNLIQQCSERDGTIKRLEEVCSQYQQEFDKLKNNSVIQNLTKNLERQDKLIEQLKAKLQLQPGRVSGTKDLQDERNEQLQQFIAKVPILKQYYMYYKYKEQHQNLGMIFTNVLTVLVTGGVMITGIRIIFLLLLQLFNSNSSGQLEYIFDDYGVNSWTSNQETVSFVWWKEIESLEFLVYSISNWLEGS